jgi:hypothetical protein
LARRYAPLVAVVALQLLIIALVPSTASRGGTGPATVAAGGEAGGVNGVVGGATAGGTSGGPGGSSVVTGPAAGGGAAVGGSAGAGGASVTGPGAAAAVPPGVTSGDTTHCVAGREFDPAIAYWAPPCVPGTPGASSADNGGATSVGVTADTITIVDNVPEYGAEVNAIDQAAGTYESFQAAQIMDAAWQKFINAHYVLYGRKVHIITHNDECTDVPPDYQCLIPEMDRLIDTYHPYMLYFSTPLCSACFQEIARRHVVGMGGQGFSDALLNANAPYLYGARESSSRMEEAFAQFYCNQLSSKNVPSRKVRFAGNQNRAQDFNGKPRVLGVISTNDPDNEGTVKNVLYKQLASLCGETVTHQYFYDQDINTAAKQVAAGIAALDTPTNPATIVLCLCDPVAPAFLFDGEQSNNYYPENVIATVQDMDLDTRAQSYEQNPDGSSSLGCPSPQLGCEYDNAFGLSMAGPQQSITNNEGLRIYHAGGGAGLPPNITPMNLMLISRDYVQMADLLENAGPHLDAATMQARAPSMGSMGGGATNQTLLSYSANNYGWYQDVRVVYFDKHAKSSYNNNPGTYIQIEGGRKNLGEFPVLPAGPPIPVPRP